MGQSVMMCGGCSPQQCDISFSHPLPIGFASGHCDRGRKLSAVSRSLRNGSKSGMGGGLDPSCRVPRPDRGRQKRALLVASPLRVSLRKASAMVSKSVVF